MKDTHTNIDTKIKTHAYTHELTCAYKYEEMGLREITRAFFDGYCSTVQGLLDWFEVDFF